MYRLTFGDPAQFLVDDVLHIAPKTLMARHARILTTFFISSELRLSVENTVGMAWGEPVSYRFFCTQALGISLEDMVQALYHASVPMEAREGSPMWRQLSKTIGYV